MRLLQSCHDRDLRMATHQRFRYVGVSVSVRAARVVFPERDRAEIASAITDILTSGVLTLGQYTRAFEDAFGAAHQASQAVATSSGTAALEIILRTLKVAGKDVIVPTNTFYATA